MPGVACERHQRPREFFPASVRSQVRKHRADRPARQRKPAPLLIGSYFTQEYALESAALFNPSMVWHPDQSGLLAGSRRFIVLACGPPARGTSRRSRFRSGGDGL